MYSVARLRPLQKIYPMKDWLFSLEPFSPLLESYTPPEASPPAERDRYKFDLFTLAIMATPVGQLTIESSTENAVVDVRIDRPGEDGFRAFGEFSYRMAPDFWQIRFWTARTWMAKASTPETPYPHTEMRVEGRVAGRSLWLTRGTSRRSIPLAAPLAGKWPLIETVRRHALSESAETLSFATLDEYEGVFQAQTLEPGDWQQAPGGFDLKPFLHTGTGQIPRVLWVDRARRVIAFRSGTEAGVLTELNGNTGTYTEARYDLRKLKLSLAE